MNGRPTKCNRTPLVCLATLTKKKIEIEKYQQAGGQAGSSRQQQAAARTNKRAPKKSRASFQCSPIPTQSSLNNNNSWLLLQHDLLYATIYKFIYYLDKINVTKSLRIKYIYRETPVVIKFYFAHHNAGQNSIVLRWQYLAAGPYAGPIVWPCAPVYSSRMPHATAL